MKKKAVDDGVALSSMSHPRAKGKSLRSRLNANSLIRRWKKAGDKTERSPATANPGKVRLGEGAPIRFTEAQKEKHHAAAPTARCGGEERAGREA